MSSRALADCVPELATTWLTIVREHAALTNGTRELIVTCTHRSVAEQYELYKKGRTQMKDGGSWLLDSDPVTRTVTNLDGIRVKSKHNLTPAQALDFAVLISGKITWHSDEYESVGLLAEGHGLIWGGRWTTIRDYPHVEVRG